MVQQICLLAAVFVQCWVGSLHNHVTTTSKNLISAANEAEKPLEALSLSPKRHKCGLKIQQGCECSKQAGTLSITCYKKGLKKVPVFDFGPTVVRTMNLEKNKITEVNIGDFYGLKIQRLLLSNNSISELNFLAFWGLEYNLDTLDLGYNKFTAVPADALKLLRNVRTLTLTGNKITVLRNYEFSYLHKLEMLSLSMNPISQMEDRSFAGTNLFMLELNDIKLDNGLKAIPTKDLWHLEKLSLNHNHINVIPNGWMQNLSSLKVLYLDYNKLNLIQEGTFKGVEHSLRTVHMNHNKLRKIPRDALRSLPNLESLQLKHNRIKKVYARSFNNSKLLSSLDLSHNQISSLGVSSLHGTDSLAKLDLRHNKLITLDDRVFYWPDLSNKKFYISENPWLCNCLLKWLKKAHRKETELGKIFTDLLDARCDRPSFLEYRPLVRVPLREFTCDHEYYYYFAEGDYYYDYEEEEEEEKGKKKDKKNKIVNVDKDTHN